MIEHDPVVRVGIDAGHPSRKGDHGAVSECGAIVECDYTMAIARRVYADMALADGIRPTLIRTRDGKVMSLRERAAVAEQARCDLVISIHVDSVAQKARRGATILHWPGNPTTKAVADCIAGAWPPSLRSGGSGRAATELWPDVRAVLGAYRCDCILTECGFASNAGDVEALKDTVVQRQIVGAIKQGLLYRLEILRSTEGV